MKELTDMHPFVSVFIFVAAVAWVVYWVIKRKDSKGQEELLIKDAADQTGLNYVDGTYVPLKTLEIPWFQCLDYDYVIRTYLVGDMGQIRTKYVFMRLRSNRLSVPRSYVILQRDTWNLPRFTLIPTMHPYVVDKTDVSFPEDPQFSDMYCITTDEPDVLRAVFSDEVRAQLRELKSILRGSYVTQEGRDIRISMEGVDNTIVVDACVLGTNQEMLPAFLEKMKNIALDI